MLSTVRVVDRIAMEYRLVDMLSRLVGRAAVAVSKGMVVGVVLGRVQRNRVVKLVKISFVGVVNALESVIIN